MLRLGQIADPPWAIFDLHTDHLGSVRAITTSSGAVTTRHDYFPFGKEIAGQFSHNTHQYTGHERDKETELDYMLARYYGAGMGRFVSVDPSRRSVRREDPQSWNRYVYGENDPLRMFDPDGESSLTFDGESKTITLFANDGTKIGQWQAANNALGKGKWEDGTYSMKNSSAPQRHSKRLDSRNGSYGTHGIFKANTFVQSDGQTRSEMGIHSGRQNKGGPEHPTLGCVRTTEDAMKQIEATAATDPLETITIEKNLAPKSTKDAGQSDSAGDGDQTYDHEATLPHSISGEAYVQDGQIVHP